MLRTRIIPALLLKGESLVKTRMFNKFTYVGDPCNTVRIFNELEVDELLFLDISATPENRKPNLNLLSDISNECFMPLGYGGGIGGLEDAKKIFDIGYEKVVVNAKSHLDPSAISQIAKVYGSQAVVASIDVKKNIFGKYRVKTFSGRKSTGKDPIVWAKEMEARGAGEILLTSIDREGTWSGFDLELVRSITSVVSIPVIAHGGCGSLKDIVEVTEKAGASAVAVGSMVVFQKKGMGVLVNFPEKKDIEAVLN
jgi:cyclase